MEDRIEVNGVWYVREENINDKLDYLEDEELELTWSEHCIMETDKYCFNASRMRKSEEGEFYDDILISFTDKRVGNRSEWEEDYWDNNNWFRGIIKGTTESMKSLKDETNMCEEGRRQFIALLSHLVESGWLKLNKEI